MEPKITESEVVEMEVELEVFDEVAAAVKGAKERCANIVLKYDTPKDIKESRSFIYDIRRFKASVNQVHKLAKAQLLVDGRAIDAKRNTLVGALDDMIEEKYAPIKLIEDAEAKKKADEEAKIKAEEERMEAERLAEIEAAQKKLAEEQEELHKKQEAFEQKESAVRMAAYAKKKAEEEARQDVINAENARKAAEEKAQYDAMIAESRRIGDVQRAKDEAAAEAQEKEREVIEAQQRERDKRAEEEMAETERINDEKHRSEVHNTIWEVIKQVPETTNWNLRSRGITQLIIDGKIPHVTIKY